MGKTKAAVKNVPAAKKEEKVIPVVFAKVRLKEPFMSLKPGVYEVEAYTGDGNPILKTDKGPVTVALDLVDVIRGKGEKPAVVPVVPVKQEQKEIKGSKAPFYVDCHGQMTINKIDIPMGLLAQDCIKAEKAIETAQKDFNRLMAKMMSSMKTDKLNKIKVLGRTFVYVPAKMSEEKIVIKDAL